MRQQARGASAMERSGRVVRIGRAMTPQNSMTNPAGDLRALLAQLRDDLGYRRIAEGLQTLERIRPEVETLAGCSGVLTGLIAQWIDAGFERPDLLQCLVAKFPTASRPALPLLDYLHLRMAEGALAMSEEDF